MKAVFISCYFLLLISVVSAQHCIIQTDIKSFSGRKVYLTKIYGHQQTLIDSAFSDDKGAFSLTVKQNDPKGMYRVVLGPVFRAAAFDKPAPSFDLIIDPDKGGVIKLSTTLEHPEDSMKVWQSEENQLYYGYIHKNQLNHKRLQMLEQLLQTYPQDKFHTQIRKQYNKLQKEFLANTNALIKRYPSAFFTKIVKLEQAPFLDAGLTEEERIRILKTEFFKPSDFEDKFLLHSDALPNKIITYLSLFRLSPETLARGGEEHQNREFITAADRLLGMAKAGDPAVFEYVLSYLIEGFNRIRNDAVLAHITNHYAAGTGSFGIADEKLKSILQKTTDYKKTAIGSTAPDIALNDSATLHTIHAGYTLLLFWASWCPHCMGVLPQIDDLYKKHKREYFEIIAISIDHNKTDWLNAIEQGNYGWINHTDLKGWESPAAKAFNVHATPMMFLLDKDKKIVAKPETVQQLQVLIDAQTQGYTDFK